MGPGDEFDRGVNIPGYTGNIDLSNRPVLRNSDGTVSTEKSFSIGTDKGEVLIPQVVNGKILDKKSAIDHYKKTGEHLGIYPDVATANDVAERVHNRFTEAHLMSAYEPAFPYGSGSNVIIPETGAAPYYYVDPRAGQNTYDAQSLDADQNEQLVNLLETLKRLGITPEPESGNISF